MTDPRAPRRGGEPHRPARGGAPGRAPRAGVSRSAGRPAARQAPRRQPTRQPRRPARPPRRPLRLGRLHGRLRYGFAAVCTLLLIIGGRLVQVQGLDHARFANAAQAQRVQTVPIQALRGSILGRHGTVLAYTSAAQDITADPQQIDPADRSAYGAKLAPLLGEPAGTIADALDAKGQYVKLASAVPQLTARKVTDLGLTGIYTQATTERQYPGATTAANIVGTVHSNGTGAAGIEAEFNSVLGGHNGTVTYSIDSAGSLNPSSRTVTDPARDGSTVRLTIDQSLQFMAQQYLDQDVAASGAKDGELAILDAHTGQVLALAASGTFDANDPNTIKPNVPLDPPVMAAFEPGSVQKALTFAGAIQEGVITPKTIISVPDDIEMGGVTIHDAWWHPTEQFTATGIIAESSNVGTLKIAQRLGPDKWFHFEHLFGIGTRTGIELPGESAGYLPPMKDWSASTFANLPFGQGESMTVLQMASAYQAIANDGVRIPPRIVESVTSPDGVVHPTERPAGIRVITPRTAKTLRTMLQSVLMPGGTAPTAAIAGYQVAGKTGTAQQPDPATGKYSNSLYWETFAGIVPADAPQFVVAVMINAPSPGFNRGFAAAPVFHKIATYELQHARIPPTGRLPRHVPLQVCDAVTRLDSPPTVC